MAIRFYIVPIVNTGTGFNAVNLAAYITEAGGSIRQFINYGGEPFALVMADVTAGQNTTIAAHADAIVIPANIENNVSAGALSAVQTALESINVPSDWVTTATTYRQILRLIGGLFNFAQRYYGLFELRLFRGGVTLSTQFNQLPVNERQRLLDCANTFNYDTSTLNGTSTIRQILRAIAVQWTKGILDRDGVTI